MGEGHDFFEGLFSSMSLSESEDSEEDESEESDA